LEEQIKSLVRKLKTDDFPKRASASRSFMMVVANEGSAQREESDDLGTSRVRPERNIYRVHVPSGEVMADVSRSILRHTPLARGEGRRTSEGELANG
jgi:hypothetical protein